MLSNFLDSTNHSYVFQQFTATPWRPSRPHVRARVVDEATRAKWIHIKLVIFTAIDTFFYQHPKQMTCLLKNLT